MPSTSPAPGPVPASDDSDTAPITVLVAADGLAQREKLKRLLEHLGYVNVRAANSGEQMFSRKEIAAADLLVIGRYLADTTAEELTGKVRTLSSSMDLPILMIAETITQAKLLKMIEQGIQDILLSPFNRKALDQKVRALTRRS